MGVTGNTQLTNVKQDLVAKLVQKELKFQAKLLPSVTDVSAFAVAGAKSISFPKFGSFTVENRTSGSAGTIQDLGVATVDKLDLTYRAYVSWLIDSTDELQAAPELQLEYIKLATSAHARNIDDIILAALDADSGYQQAAGIDQTKILNARKWLLKNQANVSDITVCVSADDEALMLAIPDFVRADAYGANPPAVNSGVIGKIYGMPVVVHTKPTLAKSFLYDKAAVAFGIQKAPSYGEQDKIEYGVGSKLVAIDQLYGSKTLQLGNGLTILGAALAADKSPLIAEIG